MNAPLHIKCCQCEQEYPFAPKQRGKTFFITCPYCDLNHIVDFIPFQKEISGDPVEEINLKDRYALLGGTRILSITAGTDLSGADDGNVTNWEKTTEFIVAVCVHSGGFDTLSSTYSLQWQDDNDGGGYVGLASDAGSPELSYTIDDASWSNGGTVATGDQVCDIQFEDTRQAGERIKDASVSDAIDLADEYQSELWFGVDSTNAEDGHVYSFQLYSTAEGAAIGVCGATIAMAAAATTTTTTTTTTAAPEWNMSGSADITFTTAADIQGKGRVQTAPDITFTTAADIQAKGLVAATSNITFTNAAILKGIGKVQAAPDITFTNAAIIKGRGRLLVAPDIVFTNAAVLIAMGDLAALSNIIFSTNAILIDQGAEPAPPSVSTMFFRLRRGNSVQGLSVSIKI